MTLNDARICSRYIVASASSVWFSCTPSILVVKVPGLSFALHNDDDDDDDNDDDDDDDSNIRAALYVCMIVFFGDELKSAEGGLEGVGVGVLVSWETQTTRAARGSGLNHY